jgi:hypothetical protein
MGFRIPSLRARMTQYEPPVSPIYGWQVSKCDFLVVTSRASQQARSTAGERNRRAGVALAQVERGSERPSTPWGRLVLRDERRPRRRTGRGRSRKRAHAETPAIGSKLADPSQTSPERMRTLRLPHPVVLSARPAPVRAATALGWTSLCHLDDCLRVGWPRRHCVAEVGSLFSPG